MHSFKIGERTVLAGTDFDNDNSLGTWLGINDKGLLAILTNNRELPCNPPSCSRGSIVMSILGREALGNIREEIGAKKDRFANFNVLMADCKKGTIEYFGSNDPTHPEGCEIDASAAEVSDPISLSNGTLWSAWPKMKHGSVMMKKILNARRQNSHEDLVTDLLTILTDEFRFPKKCLPTNTMATMDAEYLISSIFLSPTQMSLHEDTALFGTVSSAILLVGQTEAEFIEVSWRGYYEDQHRISSAETKLEFAMKNLHSRKIKFTP